MPGALKERGENQETGKSGTNHIHLSSTAGKIFSIFSAESIVNRANRDVFCRNSVFFGLFSCIVDFHSVKMHKVLWCDGGEKSRLFQKGLSPTNIRINRVDKAEGKREDLLMT